MILGNTHDETRTLIGRGDPSLFALTWETLLPELEANSPFMGTLDRGEVIAAYRDGIRSTRPPTCSLPRRRRRVRGAAR